MSVSHYNCRRQDFQALRRAMEQSREAERAIAAAVLQRDWEAFEERRAVLEHADKLVAIARLIVGEDTGIGFLPVIPSGPERRKGYAREREAYEKARDRAWQEQHEKTERVIPERIRLARLGFGDELVEEVLALGKDTEHE